MKKLLFAAALLVGAVSFAQTAEELKAEKAKLSGEVAALQGKIGSIDGQLAKFNKGWKFSGMGNIGANFAGYNNWMPNALSNSQSANIGVALNGFADLNEDKYFWKNALSINLGWTSIVDLDAQKKNLALTDEQFAKMKEYQLTTDVLNLSSLFGYKLNDKWAASALAEYRTTVAENFNNPGYLDFGVGATWTPMAELLVVLHPLNYNYVFADTGATFEASLGCKVMAEYKKDFGFLKYRSNLSGFLSYKDIENFSNWTWVNSFGFNLFKGIGVGFDTGLRMNKQEAFNKTGGKATWGELKKSDNPLQSYWLLGLSYSL